MKFRATQSQMFERVLDKKLRNPRLTIPANALF